MLAQINKAAFGQLSPIFAKAAALYPGLALATVVSLAAVFLSDYFGAPIMLLALLVGMAFNPMSEGTAATAGITFSSKTLLRAGVALLGVRVSLEDVASLGIAGFGAIAGLFLGTILLGLLLSRRDWQFGMLTGGAVAICGASAALAISACLPRGKELEQETLFTVVAVTALSTLAMILYPFVLLQLDLSLEQIAFVLGASIHDVAQVVGAGLVVSEETAELATLVKMVRVSLLPVVLGALVMFCAASGASKGGQKVSVPLFLVVFFLLAIAANVGVMSQEMIELATDLSKALLVIAIGALGIKTSLRSMVAIGGSKLATIGGLTVVLFVASILVALSLKGLA
jgi:uncharacterized integral membrane protein (TIGR00698 family)